MSTITLRIKLPPNADQLQKAIQNALEPVGTLACSIIKRRTRSGVDMNGAQFVPLSRSYRTQKVASGRSGEPDFMVTGQLLANLQVLRIEEGRIVIGFQGQHREVTFARKGRGTVVNPHTKRTVAKRTASRTNGTIPMATIVESLSQKRPFFGITQQAELSQLVRTFERALRSELQALNA